MGKVKILFVILQLDAGGSERVVFDLAKSLDRDKYEIYVAAFKSGVLAPQFNKICNEIIYIEKKTGLDISAMLKLANVVKQYRIDVVNAHHYMPCFYSFLGTRILNCKRLVYTEHSVPEVESIANCFHGKIFYWMLYKINAVIGVSKAIADKFKEIYPRHYDKIHAVVNGIDVEKFRNIGMRDEVRRRWGVTSDHFVIGTVANFRKIKNHTCLVRAFGRLNESHHNLRLFLVGTGFEGDLENSENDVRTLVKELGLEDRVVFAGYQENIPEILSAFDVFCLPSFSEGLPISLLEAMASGVPVVGSEVNGIKEVITEGLTGLMFPVNDDVKLAQAIMCFSDNKLLAHTVAINALSYIYDKHDSLKWSEAYASILSAG